MEVSHNYNYHIPKRQSFPKMEAITRIASIPLVETGLDISEKLYSTIKGSNRLTKWSLTKAEESLLAYLNLTLPVINIFTGPISRIDRILCKSLDIVEQRVPSMYLPPELIYTNAQDYMSSHFVKPVLKRADSVKQLGSAVLDSKVTAFAADKVDSVLDKADIYVDKYLPPDSQDAAEPAPAIVVDEPDGDVPPRQHVVRAMQHADRLGRKLGRRISRRTLQEARALKEQTTEAIHVLVYVAELVATDPKLAFEKAKELWAELSKDEPENQARPATLEQLVALITRESARRLVHLINFTSRGAVKLPRNIADGIRVTSRQFLTVAHSLIQKVDMGEMKKNIVQRADLLRSRFQTLLQELQIYSKKILEQLAKIIAGSSEREKMRTTRCHLRNNHLSFNANNVINGVN